MTQAREMPTGISALIWVSSTFSRGTRDCWRRARPPIHSTARIILSRKPLGSGCRSRRTGANMLPRRGKTFRSCSTGSSRWSGPCRSSEMNYQARERKTLKRAWMRFSASVSLLSLATTITTAQTTTTRQPVASIRASESRLAGLAPGQTRLARAEAVLGKPRDRESGSARWRRCDEDLVVEADSAGLIETIRITRHLGREPSENCPVVADGTSWATGKGLRLGDPAARAVRLYGRPDS